MKQHKGFSLTLFLVYLFFFSIISYSLCHVVITFILPAVKGTRTNKHCIDFHLASDIFVRDMRLENIVDLERVDSHKIIGHTGEKSIGWQYNNHTLERMEKASHKYCC